MSKYVVKGEVFEMFDSSFRHFGHPCQELDKKTTLYEFTLYSAFMFVCLFVYLGIWRYSLSSLCSDRTAERNPLNQNKTSLGLEEISVHLHSAMSLFARCFQ